MSGADPGALVLGANYRGLGVVRSLGRRGIEVWVARSDEHRLAERSRYARRSVDWPHGDPAGQVQHLLALASERGLDGWVVFPTDDLNTALLSRHRDVLGQRYVVGAPDWETLRWARDKRLTHRLGAEAGVAVPATWIGCDVDEMATVVAEVPAILKPAIRAESNVFVDEKAWPVADERELRERYAEALEHVPAEEIMLQERIPGGGEAQLSYAALADRGRVLASVTACRARQHPMDFGRASTFVHAVDAPDVAEAGRRVIAEMELTGLAEAEFKRDPRDGRLKLLDINARVWGWHTLGTRRGIDFAYLHWRLLRGQEIPERHVPAGMRWSRTVMDLPTAGREVLARRLGVGGYLASVRPPCEHPALARDDPLPGILEGPLLGALALRRALRGAATGSPAREPAERPARVLFLNQNNSLPSDRRAWNEVTALRDAGFEVTVVCPVGEGRVGGAAELVEGVEIRRYPQAVARGGALGYLIEYAAALWRIGRLVRRLGRARRFDVVHACNPPDFLLLTVLGQRRRGARLIFDHHDLAPELYTARFRRAGGLLHRLLLALERLSFRLADIVVSTNESYRRIAVQRGRKRAEDVFVVRSGPSLERFREVAPVAALKRGHPYLIAYVGEMALQDGVDHGLHALASLAGRRSDWHAIFAGDGEALPHLRRLATELGIADRLEFPGWLDDDELRPLLCTADLCLVPDPKTPLSDVSTLVKVAEYMAMGRPVVAYDLAESRVTAGEAAVYARPNEPGGIADLIEDLLDDKPRREQMGEIGRLRVRERLAWEHSAEVLLAAYRRALDTGARGR
jgi:predicted ATP-grasp superfamily ATP-dependent carboligase/glycosyltransferase involved in cell wall biosynthesis